MIRVQALTPADRLRAAPYLAMLPEIDVAGFWRRVAKGQRVPLLLLCGKEPFGLLIATVVEEDSGRELRIALATEPGEAARRRRALVKLVKILAVQNLCRMVSFESKREGWERVAGALGFGSAQTVKRFMMEVR